MWSFPTDKAEPIEKARNAGFFICAGSELILRRPHMGRARSGAAARGGLSASERGRARPRFGYLPYNWGIAYLYKRDSA